ncbi:2Fe-2S ferredoxin-type domain-containing protein [Fusarium flagelliforme]|uniref:2Fe-2S ferredoxin-type domain-containing protein n=1 Tax=Fusarium flagelliforme TaxID=2675880 RepID=UPI001E8ED05A|nr:2Fe-2S ferredoxin-type domain-containing protein [Fusarium flagelliforme]KAH7182285.1 2Fe-2S ferredoxin-type domain-containing protein [Fusarium flagelliforme]
MAGLSKHAQLLARAISCGVWRLTGPSIASNTAFVSRTYGRPIPPLCISSARHMHNLTDTGNVHVTFLDEKESHHTIPVSIGDNLLNVAQKSGLQLEGACGGECACSTCHVVVQDEHYFNSIPEASEDEDDMLDMAYGRTEKSRLGCQVKITEPLDGMIVRLAGPAGENAD